MSIEAYEMLNGKLEHHLLDEGRRAVKEKKASA